MKNKSFPPSRRLRNPFLWAVATIATFLLYQLVASLIEELPKLFGALK